MRLIDDKVFDAYAEMREAELRQSIGAEPGSNERLAGVVWWQLLREHRELRKLVREIRGLVDEQAEDEALWALNLDGTLPISEAYLQQELRRLHALVESEER